LKVFLKQILVNLLRSEGNLLKPETVFNWG